MREELRRGALLEVTYMHINVGFDSDGERDETDKLRLKKRVLVLYA